VTATIVERVILPGCSVSSGKALAVGSCVGTDVDVGTGAGAPHQIQSMTSRIQHRLQDTFAPKRSFLVHPFPSCIWVKCDSSAKCNECE
jgi:hypothetical protein